MAIIARCLLILGLLAAAPAGAQQDPQHEPSSRVGRVNVISGTLAFYGPGDTEWSSAQVNLPVATGGWFATDPKSRAQLRIGADAITLAADTQLNIADLRDDVMQIALSQGRIGLQLQKPAWRKDQTAEIDIARGGVWLLQPGDYDIDSGAPDQPTRITVFEGSARFIGGGVDKVVNAGERLVLTGAETLTAAVEKAERDDFANWCRDHGIRQDRVASARRVSPAMTGFEELDEYGEWADAADYGAVWYPKSIPADWVPYRAGRWVWVEPWGWNWVDDQPWGFAPFHYGRWAQVNDRWGWVPGEFVAQPVYAPALVAFLPQPAVEVAVPADAGPPVGWFPLAPGEVYWPAYTRNPTYIRNVNITNVRINVINQVTTAMLTRRGAVEPPPVVLHQRFANRPAATVVPAQVVLASAPVKPAVVRLPDRALRQAVVAALPPPSVARPAIAAAIAAPMPRHGRPALAPPAGAPTAAAEPARPHLPARPNFAQLAHAPRLRHGETAAVPANVPGAAPPKPAEAPAATAAIPPLAPQQAPETKHGPPSRPDFTNLPRWQPHNVQQQRQPGMPLPPNADPVARRQAAQELAQQRAAAVEAARLQKADQRAAQQQTAVEKGAAKQQEIAARLAQQRAAAEAAGQTRAAQRAAQQQALAEQRAARQQELAARLAQQRAQHQAATQQQAAQRAAPQQESGARQAQQGAAAETARQHQAEQRATQQALAAQQAQQRAAAEAARQQQAQQRAAQQQQAQAAQHAAAQQRAAQQQAIAAQQAQQRAAQQAAAQQAAAQRAAQQQALAAQQAQQRAQAQQAAAAQVAQQRAAQQQAAAQRAAQQQAAAQHAQQRAAAQQQKQQQKQAHACGGPGQPACPPH